MGGRESSASSRRHGTAGVKSQAQVARQSGRSSLPTLLPLVYDELRALARRKLRSERIEHTLQPTALVHEAYLRLAHNPEVQWQDRTHFLATAAKAMHHVLIDYARGRARGKRGGGWRRVQLDERAAPLGFVDVDVLELQEALGKLRRIDDRQCSVVEMRIFGGMTMEEVAGLLGVSKRTAEGEWTHAKAWLRRELAR